MEMAVKTMEMAVELMESMEMALGAIPCLGRVPKQRLLSLEIVLRWRQCYRTLLGETLIDLGFSRRRHLIGEGVMPEVDQGSHATPRRGQGGAPPKGVAGPWPPSGSPSDFISCREK
jgi:hypothetical protein